MTEQPWLKNSQSRPPVSWNGETKSFSIVLTGLQGVGVGGSVEAEWSPTVTYIIRIREAETENWSYGFEIPLTGCGFVYLEPNTKYEVEVRSKNACGESAPATRTFSTGPDGILGV